MEASILLLLPLILATCPPPPLASLWSNETLASGRGIVGEFCRGVLLHPHHLLLPAHCLVAQRKLASSKLRIVLPSGRKVVRRMEEELVYVHPDFSVESYIKESLLHDLAVIRYPLGLLLRREGCGEVWARKVPGWLATKGVNMGS